MPRPTENPPAYETGNICEKQKTAVITTAQTFLTKICELIAFSFVVIVLKFALQGLKKVSKLKVFCWKIHYDYRGKKFY